MNKEVIKAMNKKETKFDQLRKWWGKNGYKVLRVIFFPIWITALVIDKVNKKLNEKNFWDEERADEILSYYIPRTSDWYEEEKEFRFFDNGMGWSLGYAKKHLKRKDRRFWDVHNGFCGGKIRRFLIDDFELEGFTKKIGNCSDGWTEIVFKMIEK